MTADANETLAPATKPSSVSRLFKNATIYGIGQLAVSIISFAADPLLSYLLTRADFGLLGLTRTTTNLAALGYRLGLDGAVNRLYLDIEHDPAAQRRALGTVNTFILVWALLLTALQEIFGPAIYARLFDGVPYAPYGRFVTYTLLAGTLVVVAQSVWSAQERAQKLVGVRIASALLTNVVMFGLLLSSRLGVLSVYIAQVVGPTILLWIHLRFAWRSFGFAFDPAVLRRALAFGLPIVVHLGSHWALEAADRFIVEKYLGREAVGLYTVAYGTTTTLFMINQSVNAAYVPQFVRAQGSPDESSFVGRAITYCLLTTVAATLGFALFAPTIVRTVYAARFVESAALTPILALAAPLHAVYLVHVAVLFRASRTRFLSMLTLTAGLSNIALNLLWVPRYGLAGAAWATLASYAVLALVFWAGTRSARLPYEKGRLARLFGAAGIIVALGWGIDGRLPVLYEIGAKVLLALLAPAVLWATGFLTQEERAWVSGKLDAVKAGLS